MRLLVLPSLAPSGTLVYQWVDANGTVRSLSGNGSVNVEVGERGTGLASTQVQADKLPYFSGTVVRHLAVQPITTELPLLLTAASASAQEALRSSVRQWFKTGNEQTRTPGYLRVTRQGGTQRQRAYYYVSGLEGDYATERMGETWESVVVELYAPDSAATDIDYTEETYALADLPAVTLNNAGDLEAYPIWSIVGGFTAVTIANFSTGESFTVTLTTTDTLIADTRPAATRTQPALYTETDGVNRFGSMTAGFALWKLQPGVNDVSIQITGGSAADTEVTVGWLQRYDDLY